QIKEFLDKKTDRQLGLEDSPTWISVWVDGVDRRAREDKEKKKPAEEKNPVEKLPPLKKSARPAVKVVFGKPADNELGYAKREVGKDENRVAVPVALLNKVNRGPLAYLDRNVTGFTADDVSEITRIHGKSVDEVAREKGRASWKLLQPKGTSKYAD